MLQNEILFRKSAPWPPNIPDEFCSLLTRCTIPCACHSKRRLNVQKCSEPISFLHFWLRNVLRVTTACTFSTSQLPKAVRSWGVLCILTSKRASRSTACTFSTSQPLKVLRSWGVLCILTWKRASRHNSMQLFISHLASWLRTRRFSEPTFRPSGATNHWKNAVFHDFPTFFAHLDLLSSGFFSSLTLPISAFHLSILSEVWLLNFLRW